MNSQVAGHRYAAGTVPPLDDDVDSPGAERRVAIMIIASAVLTTVGGFAEVLWGRWVLIPMAIMALGLIVVMTALEARARQTTFGAVVRLLGRRTCRDFAARRNRNPG